jgi:hypothetical protein
LVSISVSSRSADHRRSDWAGYFIPPKVLKQKAHTAEYALMEGDQYADEEL